METSEWFSIRELPDGTRTFEGHSRRTDRNRVAWSQQESGQEPIGPQCDPHSLIPIEYYQRPGSQVATVVSTAHSAHSAPTHLPYAQTSTASSNEQKQAMATQALTSPQEAPPILAGSVASTVQSKDNGEGEGAGDSEDDGAPPTALTHSESASSNQAPLTGKQNEYTTGRIPEGPSIKGRLNKGQGDRSGRGLGQRGSQDNTSAVPVQGGRGSSGRSSNTGIQSSAIRGLPRGRWRGRVKGWR